VTNLLEAAVFLLAAEFPVTPVLFPELDAPSRYGLRLCYIGCILEMQYGRMSLTQSCPCWTQLMWALLTLAPIMLSDCILLIRNYMYVPSLLLGLSLQEVLGGPQDQLDLFKSSSKQNQSIGA